MIKRILSLLGLLLVIFCYTPASLAVPLETLPTPAPDQVGWVVDMAHILSPETKATLNQTIAEHHRHHDLDILIVTVPDTAPSKTPQLFADRLFDRWKLNEIDSKEVLMVISKGDRRIEIRTNKIAVRYFSNQQIQTLIDSILTPQFQQQHFDQGILEAIDVTLAALESHRWAIIATRNILIMGVLLLGTWGFAVLLDSYIRQTFPDVIGSIYRSSNGGGHNGGGGGSGGSGGGGGGGGGGGSW